MSKEIVALSDHVVLRAIAKSAGQSETTASGFLLPPVKESKIPTHCEIYAIGPNVPPGIFKVGDMTPFPLGEKLNVPHPDVIEGLCTSEERDEKFISTRWTNISCTYK